MWVRVSTLYRLRDNPQDVRLLWHKGGGCAKKTINQELGRNSVGQVLAL